MDSWLRPAELVGTRALSQDWHPRLPLREVRPPLHRPQTATAARYPCHLNPVTILVPVFFGYCPVSWGVLQSDLEVQVSEERHEKTPGPHRLRGADAATRYRATTFN